METDRSDMIMPFEHFLVVDNRRSSQDVSCEDSCRDSWDIAHNKRQIWFGPLAAQSSRKGCNTRDPE